MLVKLTRRADQGIVSERSIRIVQASTFPSDPNLWGINIWAPHWGDMQVPSRSRSGTRPVTAMTRSRLPGDRDRAERGGQHLGDVDTLELGLGSQPEPVHEGGVGQ